MSASYRLLSLREEIERDFRHQISSSHRLPSLSSEDIQSLDEGIVIPSRREEGKEYSFLGGVVDSEGRFVEGSLLHERPCDVGGADDYKPEKVEDHRATEAVFIGYLLPVWGHALTDGLKKLWYLNTAEGRELLAGGARVAYITLNNQPLPEYQLTLWRLAGFRPEDWRQVTRPTRFRRVIVPANSFVTAPDECRSFSPEYEALISQIKRQALTGSAAESPASPIYLSRSRWAKANELNSPSLDRLFRRAGYTVVSPQSLTVPDQIALWARAKRIAATEGSLAHGALFMQPGAELIVLTKADYVNGYQFAANALARISVTYIPAHRSSCASRTAPWAGPFYLTPTRALCRLLGVSAPLFPAWLRPNYLYYLLRCHRLMQPLIAVLRRCLSHT